MPDVKPQMSRRERLVADTRAELAAAARALLVGGGPESVTMRAVAGEVGMTGPAIYRYFDSRESLLEQVIVDLYGELAAHLASVRDRPSNDTVRKRLLATARAFRRWALDHHAEFALLFGAPVPGVVVDKSHADSTGASFGAVWLEMFVEIHQAGGQLRWPYGVPKKLADQVEAFLARTGMSIPVEAAVLYLYCWQSLYGAVCTEVFGHLRWALEDCEDFFEGRLAELAELLGQGAQQAR